MIHVTAALALPVLVLLPLYAEAQDPLQLLQKVAANYAALSKTSYDFESIELMEFKSGFQNQTQRRQRIVGSGGRYREESLPSGPLYTLRRTVPLGLQPGSERVHENEPPRHRRSCSQPRRVRDCRLPCKERSIASRGKPGTGLWSGGLPVIEVEQEATDDPMQYSPTTYWIDANRSLVLKSRVRYTTKAADGGLGPSQNTITVSISKATVGQAVDESLLRFTPPADAVLVDRMTFGPKSTMVGRDSPDFEMKGADGKPISSATLRGSTLLLQFGPDSDDDSKLFLEMTYRSLKTNGLTAVFVVPSLNQSRIGGEGYTVPVAIDPDGKAAKQFGITYTGRVLIDHLGKIAYIDTISRNSLELARALQKTRVW